MSNISQRWTEERVTDLKRMNADGLSASEIARALGAGFSRNAVIGKPHRLTGYVATAPRPKNDRGRLANKIASGTFGKPPRCPPRAFTVARPIEDMIEPIGMRTPLLELKASMCKWPLGDHPRDVDFGFCGHRRFGARVYCEYHTRLAYVPVTTRQHRQDARAG